MIAVATGLLICVAGALYRRRIDMTFKSGMHVRITTASFAGETCGDSRCSLTFDSKKGKVGHVDLLQTFWECPIIVVPSTNENIFYLLYDNDVDTQLLMVDTSKPFQPPPHRSLLSRIVVDSPWYVARVPWGMGKWDDSDWGFVSSALVHMPVKQFRRQSVPNLDFIFFCVYSDQQGLAASMHNDQPMYPGDYRPPLPESGK